MEEVKTPVDTTTAPAVETAPETPAADASTPSSSEVAQYWASYEDLEKTPWLAELPEDRKGYILSGAKRYSDDYETKLAEAKGEASTWRAFIEAENSDYFADKERATKLEGEVTAAKAEVDTVKAELAKLKEEGASMAAVQAKYAELEAARDEQKAAVEAVRAEKEELTRTIEEAGAEFHEMTDVLAEMLIEKSHSGVSPEGRTAAKAAFMKFMAENVDKFSADGKGVVDLARASYEHAASTIPKPDHVPASVKVQGGTGATVAAVGDEAIFEAYMATKGEKPEEQVAQKLGISIRAVLEALPRRAAQIRKTSS